MNEESKKTGKVGKADDQAVPEPSISVPDFLPSSLKKSPPDE
jgi:hypothetical protein